MDKTNTPITYPISFRLTATERAELDQLVEYFAQYLPWAHYSQSDVVRAAIHTLYAQQIEKVNLDTLSDASLTQQIKRAKKQPKGK